MLAMEFSSFGHLKGRCRWGMYSKRPPSYQPDLARVIQALERNENVEDRLTVLLHDSKELDDDL